MSAAIKPSHFPKLPTETNAALIDPLQQIAKLDYSRIEAIAWVLAKRIYSRLGEQGMVDTTYEILQKTILPNQPKHVQENFARLQAVTRARAKPFLSEDTQAMPVRFAIMWAVHTGIRDCFARGDSFLQSGLQFQVFSEETGFLGIQDDEIKVSSTDLPKNYFITLKLDKNQTSDLTFILTEKSDSIEISCFAFTLNQAMEKAYGPSFAKLVPNTTAS